MAQDDRCGGEASEQGPAGWLGVEGRPQWDSIGDDTRRPAAERMSMMVSTVSNRTALPAFRLVSVFVAT